MNKKALAEIMTFIVFVLLVVLMAAFLVFSALASIKSPSEESAHYKNNTEDILLKKIKLTLNNQQQDILVLDAYVLYENEEITKENFETSLSAILQQENTCLVLAKSTTSKNPTLEKGGVLDDDFYMSFQNSKLTIGTRGSKPSSFAPYQDNALLLKTDFENKAQKKVYVEYYLGACQ